MVIDSSAVVAILLNEPEAEAFTHEISRATTRLLPSITLLEIAMVLEARRLNIAPEIDLFLRESKIEIIDFSVAHAEAARIAWRRFGRGNHPAGLNFGDCCAYAVSQMTREPLLFKGDDFRKTDVRIVL